MTYLLKIPLCLFSLLGSIAHSSSQDLAPLAKEFIGSLDTELKEKACFPFDHEERFNWHFVPRERKGPTFHDFNEQQKAAALALMHASLGEPGVERTEAIFTLENILREVENRPANDDYRDPLNYHFSVFGNPGGTKEWGWRLEGHHLSLNFSSDRHTIVSSTPSFMGSNPALVLSGPEMNRQVLANETNMGFAMLHSLTKTQKSTAIFADKAPFDIITSNDRNAQLLQPIGIQYSALNPEQQKLFQELITLYLSRFTPAYQGLLQDRIIEQGWGSFAFAWAGSEINSVGEPHYYRIQGADLLIEYDNIQNNANHVHTVIRDLQNDFGGDLLLSHYQKDHGPESKEKQGK
ncbi:DUF3500 domain-containing protein [Cyclobacterium jeungdonense]|uniref:DUF3500 domain-containing protein n=1 Tax=Cyclobacterium jeungdonense TaxID=708087 RepID=A0ABT8C3Y8_9BACT|nr:DUF3500 domain-containing protein [Cyclobacterium jeungdonense]MDN3686461.1 DUF3500 domain-containing protein [Cyclobacterium jeungdonense]